MVVNFFTFPSICMAAGPGHLPDLTLLATFAAGSFVMRGAGCTINDMWDRNIDNKVLNTLNVVGHQLFSGGEDKRSSDYLRSSFNV